MVPVDFKGKEKVRRMVGEKADLRDADGQLLRGPNDLPICRYCTKEVMPPKRTFCSAGCVHEFKLRSQPKYLRQCVFFRDKGICAVCGKDTVQLVSELRALETKATFEVFKAKLANNGLTYAEFRRRTSKDKYGLFDADHIIEVTDGGGVGVAVGKHFLDNIQSLCTVCHRSKTAGSAQSRRKNKLASSE